jgi:hypothetical protein
MGVTKVVTAADAADDPLLKQKQRKLPVGAPTATNGCPTATDRNHRSLSQANRRGQLSGIPQQRQCAVGQPVPLAPIASSLAALAAVSGGCAAR